MLAQAAEQLTGEKRALAVLCAQALDAQRLRDEIPFFAPELRVHLLPDWETLPYDQFSPHQDLVSPGSRLMFVNALWETLQSGVAFVSEIFYLSRTGSVEAIGSQALHQGEELNHATLSSSSIRCFTQRLEDAQLLLLR